jgi:hypothetical protein
MGAVLTCSSIYLQWRKLVLRAWVKVRASAMSYKPAVREKCRRRICGSDERLTRTLAIRICCLSAFPSRSQETDIDNAIGATVPRGVLPMTLRILQLCVDASFVRSTYRKLELHNERTI